MKIQTYIINLEKSVLRREYMDNLLSIYSFLDIHYVKGVEGKKLSIDVFTTDYYSIFYR